MRELGRSVWTDSVSERFASIKATLECRGERIEDFDAAVAAHALAESAVLVTAYRGIGPHGAELTADRA